MANVGMAYPLWKLPPWYAGQIGIQGSNNELGFRMEPQGLVYYVDGSHAWANDGNQGTDPSAPKATIQSAITASNATLNWALTPPYAGINLIVISPGVYAENLTPPYYCNVLGLGHANGGDWCVNVEPAAGSALAGNGNYTHWKNIRFTTNTAVPTMDLAVTNSMIVEDCMIVSGNGGVATTGIDMESASGIKIINNNFAHTATPFTNAGILCQGNFFDCAVKGNRIRADTTGIDLSAGGLFGNSIIEHNHVYGGADGINVGANGLVFVVDNFVMATNAAPAAIIHPAAGTYCIANHTISNGVALIIFAGTT